MENNILDENLLASNILKTRIYSKKAIQGFSIFFTTVFGGVLLMQNLLNSNKKKEAYAVLFISILFTAVSIIILNMLNTTNTSITFLFNAAGGFMLIELFQKKHFAEESQYEIKKIWKALIVSVLITIPFFAALFYDFKK